MCHGIIGYQQDVREHRMPPAQATQQLRTDSILMTVKIQQQYAIYSVIKKNVLEVSRASYKTLTFNNFALTIYMLHTHNIIVHYTTLLVIS